MKSCEKLDESKIKKCSQEIIEFSVWEPLKSNLIAALKKSHNNVLNIKFDSSLDRAAITKVEFMNGHYIPVIILGKSGDTNELLITLNHELVHYLSTFERISLLSGSKKIEKCLTEYQLATLKDEAPAFKAELIFWNNAPEKFKTHFKNDFFYSKLFKKKLNYDEFYRLLVMSISADKNFILKKYIDMGEYSQCAKNII
ncbi:hypothetical protein SHI21_03885 [Bacteriovorax sp. PP10]|uniref:IrrE N-terminal-like domain-containing protein n=1 Tax=Bacteriovorax antarcticus TaxID=3088717 RepID=A0ABU5VQL4_9BACT|nr:hypothetical protein [Bacteriovorax sp. PP10]MEA9355323.1 hypothetical protein [Bacteriovorax sp. PP10]